MKRYLLCLNELPLFQGIGRTEFTNACLNTPKKALSKGELLFRQGESANAIYLVKSGKLKLAQITEDGREIIADFIGPGEVLGETSLFQEQVQLFNAVALEDSILCYMSRQQFEKLIREYPDFAIKIISYLGNKLYENMRQAGESVGTSVKNKLLRLLIRLAEEYGQKTTGGTIIELVITQQDMANMVGASRVAIAQVLKEFKNLGLVNRQGKYYILNTQQGKRI